MIYKRGDLMDAAEPIIVHGCNAQGVMGSGVAKAVRDKYPKAYSDYHSEYVKKSNRLSMGQVIWTWIGWPRDLRVIGNAVTQEFYGRDGKRYVDYDAVRMAFVEVRRFLDSLADEEILQGDGPYVAIPRIGAGLGGGDWETIAEIISDAMGDYEVVVYDL